jgi:hypothetical protein
VWWWRRRRRRGQVPTIPPDLEARDRLQQLAGRDLPRQGRLKDFFFHVSEIVKDYLGKELGVVVLERTTSEILTQLPELNSLNPEPETVSLVAEFLRNADRVKFARHPATPADADVALRRAFEIIRRVHALAMRSESTTPAGSPHDAEVVA